MTQAFGGRVGAVAALCTVLTVAMPAGSACGGSPAAPAAAAPASPDAAVPAIPGRPSAAAIRAIRALQREHFGRMKDPGRRADGCLTIAAESDPDRLMAMAMLLRDEADDVRLTLLERLSGLTGTGHAILAWIAIVDDDPGLRGAATMRIAGPAAPEVGWMLRAALRDGTSLQQDRAAELAAWLGATDLLPWLIDRLVTCRRPDGHRRDGGVGIGLGVDLVVVSGEAGAPGSIGGPASRVGLAHGGSRISDARGRERCRPRPAIHAAVLALARRVGGEGTPDHGHDRSRWHAWLTATTGDRAVHPSPGP